LLLLGERYTSKGVSVDSRGTGRWCDWKSLARVFSLLLAIIASFTSAHYSKSLKSRAEFFKASSKI
jgi:hypothetical protein